MPRVVDLVSRKWSCYVIFDRKQFRAKNYVKKRIFFHARIVSHIKSPALLVVLLVGHSELSSSHVSRKRRLSRGLKNDTQL